MIEIIHAIFKSTAILKKPNILAHLITPHKQISFCFTRKNLKKNIQSFCLTDLLSNNQTELFLIPFFSSTH
jgi:hypothetical protein